MQNKKFKVIVFFFLSMIMIMSCSKSDDEAVIAKPTSDIVKKIEVIMHEGHLHGSSFHGNPPVDNNPLKRIQRITLEKQNNNWVRVATGVENELPKDKPFTTVGSYTDQDVKMNNGTRYAFEIIYYNEKGERVNAFFEKNSIRFQGFYTIDKYTDLVTKKEVKVSNGGADLLHYRYRDTNPENVMMTPSKQGVGLAKNLLGLKGYLAIKKGRISYNLKVTLREWLKGEKSGDDKYNELSPSDTSYNDLVFNIPIDVITERGTTDESFIKYKEELAKYFGLTIEELKDLDDQDSVQDESSKFWM